MTLLILLVKISRINSSDMLERSAKRIRLCESKLERGVLCRQFLPKCLQNLCDTYYNEWIIYFNKHVLRLLKIPSKGLWIRKFQYDYSKVHGSSKFNTILKSKFNDSILVNCCHLPPHLLLLYFYHTNIPNASYNKLNREFNRRISTSCFD